MPPDSHAKLKTRHLISIRVCVLIVLATGIAMAVFNQFDALGGMGNPSAESTRRTRQTANTRNLFLWVIIGGSVVVLCANVARVIDLDKAARARDDHSRPTNSPQDSSDGT